MLVERNAKKALNDALEIFPAVALLGLRQTGKTTLARSLVSFGHSDIVPEYFDLENPADRIQVTSDPLTFFRAHARTPIILDEIHRTPEIFPILRGVIDERRTQGQRTGQFLFLGSASLDLLKQSSESLTGRIGYVELTGFLATEVQEILVTADATIDHLWLRGGLPDSFLAMSDDISFSWRTAFLRGYIERDIPLFGIRIPSETTERLLTIIAHSHGGLLNASRIASGLDMSSPSIARYLGFLEDLLLVRSLRPLIRNIGKRMVKSPKIYLRDSGLVHALLGIRTIRDLLGHPIAGATYEGFVIENIIAAAGPNTLASFYRTASGAEIDLVLERGQDTIAIEVKRSLSPKLSQGFINGCDDIGATKRFFVYPGDRRFSLGNSTEAIPLCDLLRILTAK